MNPTEYVQNAIRTEAPVEKAIERFNNLDKTKIINLIQSSIDTLKIQDNLKKSIFYGKNFISENGEPANYCDTKFIRIFHGILGISTEAGELQEALMKIMNGETPDMVNIAEEISDVFWYCAIICSVLNISMESIMEKNIAKLKARYPDKFTEEKAINRDLNKEYDILSSDIVKHDYSNHDFDDHDYTNYPDREIE